MTRKLPLLAALLALPLAPVLAESHLSPYAAAEVSGAKSDIAGSVTLYETASGTVLARINLSGLPEGPHGIHLHETGDCSAADFSSAGGHIAGNQQHGVLAEGGPHPGDMPNMVAGADGLMKGDAFLPLLDLEGMIADGDGAALIVHADTDDYSSQPSGNAGSRLACGVFEVK